MPSASRIAFASASFATSMRIGECAWPRATAIDTAGSASPGARGVEAGTGGRGGGDVARAEALRREAGAPDGERAGSELELRVARAAPPFEERAEVRDGDADAQDSPLTGARHGRDDGADGDECGE